MNNIIIKTTNLTKTFSSGKLNEVQAVKNINLEIKANEIVLVIGPSGSGKTTLLSMLGGLLKPTSGDILFKSQNLSAFNQNKLTTFRLNNISYIFQSFRLLNSLTVFQNIELILSLKGINNNGSKERIKNIMQELQIENKSSFYPSVLSGGEKQRVAIARALANDSDLILADEPTGSLDSRTGKTVIELFCRLSEIHNKTVIIVSHDLRLKENAHRILNMEDGKLKYDFENNHYHECNVKI